jgi:hypothetical protein
MITLIQAKNRKLSTLLRGLVQENKAADMIKEIVPCHKLTEMGVLGNALAVWSDLKQNLPASTRAAAEELKATAVAEMPANTIAFPVVRHSIASALLGTVIQGKHQM